PWGSTVVLCGSPEEVAEARLRLHRVGYEVAGALDIGNWIAAKQPVFSNEPIAPQELYRRMKDGSAPVIVDVRLPTEWMGLRIGNVLNMPLNQLSELSSKLDPAQPVTTVCNSAYRSSMGLGLLDRNGFKKVASMAGGGEAWITAGLPVLQPTAPGTAAAQPKRLVPLPDLIDPAQLKRMLMDLPGTFDLVDIRPTAHFSDYNLPGSRNVDVADLINNSVYLTGAGPLVIVDRDGSVALMAGGILAQKTARPIKVLFGGLSAYWNTAEMGEPVKAVPIAPGVPAAKPSIAPQTPDAPKKKSAGC
ncbi:MAG: rhodanese-like domain-containing protein, partial [Syntrophobacterales bacterium]